MNQKIPLIDLTVSQSAIREVTRTLKSGWLTSGPQAKRFEVAVAKIAGARYAAAVNSGTAGLILALQVVGVKAGREVITSPFTFVATVPALNASNRSPCSARSIPSAIWLRVLLWVQRKRIFFRFRLTELTCLQRPKGTFGRAISRLTGTSSVAGYLSTT